MATLNRLADWILDVGYEQLMPDKLPHRIPVRVLIEEYSVVNNL